MYKMVSGVRSIELQFDTRQYKHIIWEKPEDFREQLRNRILAVVGEGPRKTE